MITAFMTNGHQKIFCLWIILMCIICFSANAQKSNSNLPIFTLTIQYKDTGNIPIAVAIKTSFADVKQLYDYTNALPTMLASKGYLLASIDSTWQGKDTLYIKLYLGNKYNWVQLNTAGIDDVLLYKIGYSQKNFTNKPFNIAEINTLKEKLLKQYENDGYPFAKIFLDSIKIINNDIAATLTVNKMLLYKIDSIKNYGKLQLSPKFMQRYLNIKYGSAYNIEKLKDVDRRMLDLPYATSISPSTISMLTKGAVLNLNIDAKKSSEVSAIIGVLPDANNTGKLQITGDVNLDLKNILGGGEGILFKYQALQPKSPRLNLGFDKPFIFNSPFGVGVLFELFKKDSTFLQLNAQASVQLNLSKYQAGKLFVQIQSTSLLEGGIDSLQIKQQKKLPNTIDVKSTNVGINFEYRKTNYRFNPVKGNEINFTSAIGIKNIQKNSDILALISPNFNYASLYDSVKLNSYQLRVKLAATHYFPISKTSTFKAALNTALYSSPTIFRNEVFQIGGYKLLRGFDEESIYATRYAVFTAEYRALISLNSYFFTFIDLGSTTAKYQAVSSNNFFAATGLGILYETKAGLLNVSLALGKRNDVPFKLSQAAKIHFGYINYF